MSFYTNPGSLRNKHTRGHNAVGGREVVGGPQTDRMTCARVKQQ